MNTLRRLLPLMFVSMLLLVACGGDDSDPGEANGDREPATSTSAASSTDGSPTPDGEAAGGGICDQVPIDPAGFGEAIGREGLEVGEVGEADPDFFRVEGVSGCRVRFADPVQPNRTDGFSVWTMPATSATAEELVEGVVSINPSNASSEVLANGYIAVRNGDLYLGLAGSDGTTSVYVQINPRMETPDLLTEIVEAVLKN